MFTNESEAYDPASVVPIHTRSELSSAYDSAYDSASVASVNQPLAIRYILVIRYIARSSSSFLAFLYGS